MCLETGDPLSGRGIGQFHGGCAGIASSRDGRGRVREGESLAAPRAFDLDVHRGDHCNYLLDSGRLIWHMVGRAVSAQTRPGL